MKYNVCCVFGHRTINITEQLKLKLYDTIERLIVDKNVDTFLFGSKSQFDDLCYELVSKIKEKYPHIKRVYVRAEYPYISEQYKDYLLKNYEYTYYPQKIIDSGKAVYIKRNYEMIDKSKFCIVYYDEKISRISGTKIAFEYAVRLKREIVNLM